MGTQPKCVQTPNMMSHSGLFTRSESGWGSRSFFMSTDSASLISSGVRWRMKTGLPRHLIITWSEQSRVSGLGLSWSWERRHSYVFAFRNCRQIDFDFGLGKHIGRGGHVDQKVYRRALNQRLCLWHNLVQHEIATRLHSDAPCTVAFAPAAANKPIDPTTKYWKTRFDTSGR